MRARDATRDDATRETSPSRALETWSHHRAIDFFKPQTLVERVSKGVMSSYSSSSYVQPEVRISGVQRSTEKPGHHNLEGEYASAIDAARARLMELSTIPQAKSASERLAEIRVREGKSASERLAELNNRVSKMQQEGASSPSYPSPRHGAAGEPRYTRESARSPQRAASPSRFAQESNRTPQGSASPSRRSPFRGRADTSENESPVRRRIRALEAQVEALQVTVQEKDLLIEELKTKLRRRDAEHAEMENAKASGALVRVEAAEQMRQAGDQQATAELALRKEEGGRNTTAELEALKLRYSELQAQVAPKTADSSELVKELSSLRSQTVGLEREQAGIQAREAAMHSAKTMLKKRNDVLEARLQDIQARAEHLQEQLSVKDTECARLAAEARHQAHHGTEVRTEIASLMERLGKEEGEARALRARCEDITAYSNKLQQQLQEAKRERDEIAHERAELVQEQSRTLDVKDREKHQAFNKLHEELEVERLMRQQGQALLAEQTQTAKQDAARLHHEMQEAQRAAEEERRRTERSSRDAVLRIEDLERELAAEAEALEEAKRVAREREEALRSDLLRQVQAAEDDSRELGWQLDQAKVDLAEQRVAAEAVTKRREEADRTVENLAEELKAAQKDVEAERQKLEAGLGEREQTVHAYKERVLGFEVEVQDRDAQLQELLRERQELLQTHVDERERLGQKQRQALEAAEREHRREHAAVVDQHKQEREEAGAKTDEERGALLQAHQQEREEWRKEQAAREQEMRELHEAAVEKMALQLDADRELILSRKMQEQDELKRALHRAQTEGKEEAAELAGKLNMAEVAAGKEIARAKLATERLEEQAEVQHGALEDRAAFYKAELEALQERTRMNESEKDEEIVRLRKLGALLEEEPRALRAKAAADEARHRQELKALSEKAAHQAETLGKQIMAMKQITHGGASFAAPQVWVPDADQLQPRSHSTAFASPVEVRSAAEEAEANLKQIEAERRQAELSVLCSATSPEVEIVKTEMDLAKAELARASQMKRELEHQTRKMKDAGRRKLHAERKKVEEKYKKEKERTDRWRSQLHTQHLLGGTRSSEDLVTAAAASRGAHQEEERQGAHQVAETAGLLHRLQHVEQSKEQLQKQLAEERKKAKVYKHKEASTSHRAERLESQMKELEKRLMEKIDQTSHLQSSLNQAGSLWEQFKQDLSNQ
ncbi:hypothetical protein CYMTET_10916 [Cymbomonas tetramitiformis]|uniref:Uncharacterized protein n=1 Tax=Cymbomonas tetramitiformis TaxID=36881 RepID=A0AAE0LDI2_9CHLO|nr:hypothetical protein CYMTET_10916 [Cymbomonas tetramitiformis]